MTLGYGSGDELLRYIRAIEWCDGFTTDMLWHEWGIRATSHVMERMWAIVEIGLSRCEVCGSVAPLNARYCPQCGNDIFERKKKIFDDLQTQARKVLDEYTSGGDDELPYIDDVFPSQGVYIYYHSVEGYKIGQAENVPRRMLKHECSAPSLELLHVIETSDLDWTERFIHKKFARRRRHSNHEYFDLTCGDLCWLFSIKVLEPPRTEVQQHSLLDLL